ncbi:MAG: His/Gly/Thr/Pro-type tRNA ligase C-terminal domain-containing protein [Chloroflexota bacterium]
MKYRDLSIQTQREAPNNARTEGFAFLVRAGYMTRESQLTRLGEHAIDHLSGLQERIGGSFFDAIRLPVLGNEKEIFFPMKPSLVEVAHCTSCHYTDRAELARFAKVALPHEEQLPLEKVYTPECDTIDLLAKFLEIPQQKTAKALMFTRASDDKLVFVVVRGDMQMSEAKLRNLVGDFRLATDEELTISDAAAGYASPIGLKNALVIVDDLIPQSSNLVAGANQLHYHFKNTNYDRDYKADIVADLVRAREGDGCPNCGQPLSIISCLHLATHPGEEYDPDLPAHREFYFENILLALAEAHHDEKGLALPKSAAPFEVYLMHIPGKEIDTRAKAEEIHDSLQSAGISVLFDDRDERAGVKFNDADLIGCPVRVTVGEKNLKEGMVELKPRKEKENKLVPLNKIVEEI